MLADRVGALEDPVLPRGQAREDFRFHGFGSDETQVGFHAGQAVRREAGALLEEHPDLVIPVDIVERESNEAELLGLACIERLADLFLRTVEIRRIGLKARLQPRQPVAHRVRAEIHRREFDRRRRAVVALLLADQHVGPVSREHQFGQRADEAGTRLDQRHQRARGDVDALEHPLPVLPDFVDQPVRLVGFQKCIAGQNAGALAMRLEHQHRGFEFVDAQVKDRVVKFARHLQRPERCALRDHAVDIGGRACVRRLDRNGGDALGAIDIDIDKAVADAVVVEAARQGRERNAVSVAVALRGGGEFA